MSDYIQVKTVIKAGTGTKLETFTMFPIESHTCANYWDYFKDVLVHRENMLHIN